MKNIYEEWRSYENDFILLRPVELSDAEELLKVYSDPQARILFNCDNFPQPCYFDTAEQMQKELQFYLNSYQWKYFVRWTVIDKRERTIIGTIENFRREFSQKEKAAAIAAEIASEEVRKLPGEGTAQELPDASVLLRIDLRSDYETPEIVSAILQLVLQTSEQDFGCRSITTKAVPEAAVRRGVLREFGFVPLAGGLIGEGGQKIEDYYILRDIAYSGELRITSQAAL